MTATATTTAPAKRGRRSLPKEEVRSKKFLCSMNPMEHALAVKIAHRLGNSTPCKPGLASAMREQFLNLATEAEIDEVLDELGY